MREKKAPLQVSQIKSLNNILEIVKRKKVKSESEVA